MLLPDAMEEMATKVEIAREYTLHCATRMARGEQTLKEVSMAKNFATETSDAVTYEAVQIFGGMGFMKDMEINALYRTVKTSEIAGGSMEIRKLIVAKELLQRK